MTRISITLLFILCLSAAQHTRAQTVKSRVIHEHDSLGAPYGNMIDADYIYRSPNRGDVFTNFYSFRFDFDSSSSVTVGLFPDKATASRTYDSYDRPITYTHYDGNPADSQKIFYSYDAGGRLTTTITQAYSFTALRIANNTRETSTYDISTGNKLYSLTEAWNETTNNWDNNELICYQYDLSGHMLLDSEQIWQSGAWADYQTYTYTFGGGLQTSKLYKNNYSLPLTNVELDSMYYDTGGKLQSSLTKQWNMTTAQWDPVSKSEYLYDAGGNDTATYISSWSNTSGKFEPYNKSISTFDGGNHELTMYNMAWNPTADSYSVSSYRTSTYNSFGQPLTKETATLLLYVDTDTSYFIPFNYQRYEYLYELYTPNSILTWLIADGIKIYPCPALNIINVSGDSGTTGDMAITVYDMAGRTMARYNDHVNGQFVKAIPTGHLINGEYIMRITAGGYETDKRFTVLH